MQVTRLLTDDTAVSPVIGVILMVAITVILAAVIGTFVIDLGGGLETKTNPNARFDFSYTDSSPGGSCNALGNAGTLDITHQSGDSIDENRLTIRDDDGKTETFDCSLSDGATVSAGTTVAVGVDRDDTVRVIWTSKNTDPDSQQTATLATWEGPDA